MGLFGKKSVNRDEIIKQGIAEAEAAAAAAESNDKEDEISTGNPKVDMELTKIKAQLQGFSEVRKSNSERFSRITEQLGELRGMIVDTNKAISKVEVAATKAVDLVNSVHPEKLMIEVRRQDGKIEALRANIESNEAIMQDLMSEVKKMRDEVKFFKGVEQVAKMNEEVKRELANIKKMEAVIERHADKVETIFLEVEKKFAEFDKFNDIAKNADAEIKRLSTEFDKLKLKLDQKEDKKEFVKLMNKFNEFEKHTTTLLKLLDDRVEQFKEELKADFEKMKKKVKKDLENELRKEVRDDDFLKRVLASSPDESPTGDDDSQENKSSSENLSSDSGKGSFFKKGVFKIISKKLDSRKIESDTANSGGGSGGTGGSSSDGGDGSND